MFIGRKSEINELEKLYESNKLENLKQLVNLIKEKYSENNLSFQKLIDFEFLVVFLLIIIIDFLCIS